MFYFLGTTNLSIYQNMLNLHHIIYTPPFIFPFFSRVVDRTTQSHRKQTLHFNRKRNICKRVNNKSKQKKIPTCFLKKKSKLSNFKKIDGLKTFKNNSIIIDTFDSNNTIGESWIKD